MQLAEFKSAFWPTQFIFKCNFIIIYIVWKYKMHEKNYLTKYLFKSVLKEHNHESGLEL